MENTELVYSEYKRLVERYDQLLDSSFADIRLYGILGPLLMGSSSLLQTPQINLIKDSFELFVVLLLLIFLIAIIAYRDLLKQTYLQQIGYNIRKYELYLRDKVLTSKEIDYEIFTLRKSWVERYFNITKISYAGFLFIFFLTITVIPALILWKQCWKLSVILSVITIFLLIIHSILSSIIFKKTNNYEA